MDRPCINIGGDGSLVSVCKCCFLGHMLSADGDTNAAVEARVRKGRDGINLGSAYLFVTSRMPIYVA